MTASKRSAPACVPAREKTARIAPARVPARARVTPGVATSMAIPDARNAVKTTLLPSANAAAVITCYGGTFGVDQGHAQALFDELADGMLPMWDGDMKRPEAMLFGQAQALQSVFTTLARRAESQSYLKQWEGTLRMALKAQNQCRMTLETLATLKNPPVVFVRQANINNGGQQQVNNDASPSKAPSPASAANPSTVEIGLLETRDGERLDSGTASQAVEAHQVMATVGTIDGATDCQRQEDRVEERLQGRPLAEAARTVAPGEPKDPGDTGPNRIHRADRALRRAS